MGRPAKNGVYDFKLKAQKCNQSCPDYDTCTIRLNAGSKCKKRDRNEYYVKYIHIKNMDGSRKRKEVYGRTIEELVQKVAQYEEKKSKEIITLGDWVEIWKKNYIVETKMRPSSCKFYRSLIKHIPTSLRVKKITEIRPIDIENLLNDLLQLKGLSTKTVRSFRTMLISCIDRAIDNNIVKDNAVRKTKPPKLQQREISFLNCDEIHKLLAIAESGKYYDNIHQASENMGSCYLTRQWAVVIHLALATGMRRGEVFGMGWDDLDFEKAELRVRHNLQNGKLSEPKTHSSKRYITLDTGTIAKLRKWEKIQTEYAEEVGDMYNNRFNLVFTNVVGNPVNFDNFRNRYFNKMVLAAGIPATITFHSLRHTHATMLLSAGVDAKTVSSRLGHSTTAFTLQVYAHVLHEMERSAADAIGRVLQTDVKS